MGRPFDEAEFFKGDLTEQEIKDRTCAKCGVFDIAHNDGYRKDLDVKVIPCKQFVKPTVALDMVKKASSVKDVPNIKEVKKPDEKEKK